MKRLADDRCCIAANVRQELLSRLERLRLEALGADSDGAFRTGAERRAIPLVARVDNDRFVLAWDPQPDTNTSAAALDEPQFITAIRLGEWDELVARLSMRESCTP